MAGKVTAGARACNLWGTTMYEELWAGVELKVSNTEFFFRQMEKSLQPSERNVRRSTEAIVDTQWQQAFYAHFDAFLVMGRSVPEIVNCCFGKDTTNEVMKNWFNGLDVLEQKRRRMFSSQLENCHEAFGKLPLSLARNVTVHRTGLAPVKVTVSGRFGVSYTGGPDQRVPDAETRPIFAGEEANQGALWAATEPPAPIQPKWADFTIAGKPLLPECQAYLEQVQSLLKHARGIAQQVHGGDSLTPPPS